MADEVNSPQETPLAMTVTKKPPSHWIRSLTNTALVLLGTGAFQFNMSGKLDKPNEWVGGAAVRDERINAKLDQILKENDSEMIHDTIRDTIYYKLP